MTQEQRNLLLQAMGAIKAALGTPPELPFVEPAAESVDLTGLRKKTRELAAQLYAPHGMKPIDWHDVKLRRMMFDAGYNYADNFLISLEQRGLIRVDRSGPKNKRIVSFAFIHPVTA